MRLSALLPLLLLAAACGKGNDGIVGKAEVAGSTEDDAESGQGRALEAGRALIGKRAPAALLRTIDGASIDLASAYGHKPVYLKFWATWCIPCREQMPGFEADYEKYRDQILTVAVNTGFNDSEDAVRDYRRQHGLQMPIAIDDGTLGTALNLRVTPQHVVIGRNGRILYVGHAADDRLRQALADAIREPAATAPVAPSDGTSETAATESALDVLAGVPLTGAIADGKPRVLVFFTPWCESYFATSRPAYAANCKRMREEVNTLVSAGGVHWVGISSGLWSSAKDLQDYRSSKSMLVPLYLDATGRLFRSFDVRDVPTAIVLDRRGRIVRRVGPTDGNLAAAIRMAEARS